MLLPFATAAVRVCKLHKSGSIVLHNDVVLYMLIAAVVCVFPYAEYGQCL